MRLAAVLALLAVSTTAAADPELRPQAHADLGLSVVGLGYERPVTSHVAVAGEAGIFGTYFLPWFDLGDDVLGLQVGTRVTWFARTTGNGFYVAPYLRGVAVRGEDETRSATGLGVTAGVFAGWSVPLTGRLDLRLGAGAQVIHVSAGPFAASTPFVALDILLGYRL